MTILLPLLIQTAIQLPGISIVLSALIAVIGALIYGLASNAKFAEIGRIAFAMGLLAFLLLFK